MSRERKTDREPWTPIRDSNLMDLVAEGLSFQGCADVMRLPRMAAIGRFHRLRETMGGQAA